MDGWMDEWMDDVTVLYFFASVLPWLQLRLWDGSILISKHRATCQYDVNSKLEQAKGPNSQSV
jgi:hypothetical protein